MILGVTPARGGSKGLRRKNVRLVAGRPLLAWTIEQALASRLLDRYLVSTEDAEIAAVARSLGAEVLARPTSLAGDDVSTGEVLKHVVEEVPEARWLVVLQATSPVRGARLVDRCIERFATGCDGGPAESLATGYWSSDEPYGRHWDGPQGGSPYRGWDAPRQQKTRHFFDDGSVYVVSADLIRAGDRYGERQILVETSRAENVDVDDAFDLWLAEQILQRERRPGGTDSRAAERVETSTVEKSERLDGHGSAGSLRPRKIDLKETKSCVV